jgi:hypothetical protein
MWRNALVATITVLTGFLLLALVQLDFLMPYKHYLLARYGTAILVYLGLLAVNLFGLFFWTTRKLLLKDTGRKLVHLEKQLRAGEVARDLSDRLQGEAGE